MGSISAERSVEGARDFSQALTSETEGGGVGSCGIGRGEDHRRRAGFLRHPFKVDEVNM